MTSKRSIIKTGDKSLRKKRLSFAPVLERESPETERDDQANDTSERRHSSALGPVSWEQTDFGICYKAPAAPSSTPPQYKTIPMKKSQRNCFVTALSCVAPSQTANVMVVGNKYLGEKFKAYLLDYHQEHKTAMNQTVNLNIVCNDEVKTKELKTAHFIIILFYMNTHQSIKYLSSVIKEFDKVSVPTKRTLVITVSSAEGCYKNVVDLRQLHTLLNVHQLHYMSWKEQGRLEDMEIKMMMALIYKSVGCHRGTSLLMDATLKSNIRFFTDPQE